MEQADRNKGTSRIAEIIRDSVREMRMGNLALVIGAILSKLTGYILECSCLYAKSFFGRGVIC
jgi:hypothetical protein